MSAKEGLTKESIDNYDRQGSIMSLFVDKTDPKWKTGLN